MKWFYGIISLLTISATVFGIIEKDIFQAIIFGLLSISNVVNFIFEIKTGK